VVPPGTVVSGDAYVAPGTRVGRGVTLEAGVVVTAAALPDGVTVMRQSLVGRCEVKGAHIHRGTRIGGDLYLAPGVLVGANVRLHKGVRINCVCRIPDGVDIMPAAIVGRFRVGPRVALPPGTRIGGNLCLEEGATVGKGVRFGAGAVVRAGVAIPDGARLRRGAEVRRLEIAADASLPDCYTLCGDAVVGAGAGIGERVVLGSNVEVGPGVMLPPGVLLIDGARVAALRMADDVVLPAGTRLGGDLVLRRGVRVGQDLGLGSGADIGPHVVLPDGIVVEPGARVRMLNVAAGVSSADWDASSAARAYGESIRALRIALADPTANAISRWDRAGAFRALTLLPVAGPVDPIDPRVRTLLEHPPLARTVETFLDRAGDAAATARTLRIHRATLYQRLARVDELCALDVQRSGEDRLTAHVGLRLAALAADRRRGPERRARNDVE